MPGMERRSYLEEPLATYQAASSVGTSQINRPRAKRCETNSRIADDMFGHSRAASISAMRSLMVAPRSWAIFLNPSQNASSSAALVLIFRTTTPRFTTGDFRSDCTICSLSDSCATANGSALYVSLGRRKKPRLGLHSSNRETEPNHPLLLKRLERCFPAVGSQPFRQGCFVDLRSDRWTFAPSGNWLELKKRKAAVVQGSSAAQKR
jgi:hypothetical protein